MGNKSRPELILTFLVMSALCLEALTIESRIKYLSVQMTWTEARLYCQRNHIDLVTWKAVNKSWLAKFLVEIRVGQIWIGLLRDPENDSVWKWINVKTGEGISGDNLSQSSNWADGEQSSHCAAVEDLHWHSAKCSRQQGFYCSEGDNIKYHDVSLNWYNASQYCRDNGGELATVTKPDVVYKPGWIGLYRVGGETWSWIGDGPFSYRNWATEEPLNADCASFDPATEKWYSNLCSKRLPLACYDDNLVLVNKTMTWEDALRHCWEMETPRVDSAGPREYGYNLLSLNVSEYSYVRDRIYRATTDEVWTGLRFLGGEWWWVNGQALEDQGMLPDCPSQWNVCGTLSKYDTNNWITRDCSEKRNFICYRHKI